MDVYRISMRHDIFTDLVFIPPIKSPTDTLVSGLTTISGSWDNDTYQGITSCWTVNREVTGTNDNRLSGGN